MADAVKSTLETYFASLNSTSSRMMADINFAREQFGDKWDNLSCLEQSDSLWKALVKPEVADKYKLYPETHPDVEYFPILRITPGEKIIVDEDAAGTKNFGCSWRDEHSAPFHWETQSQLDLHLSSESKTPEEVTTEPPSEVAGEELVEVKKEEEVKRPVLLKRPEVPPPPVPPHAAPPPVPPHAEETPPVPPHAEKPEMPIYAKVVKRKSSAKTLVISDMKAHKKAVEEMKPAIPPRMSLELKGDIDHASYRTVPANHLELIPKTGFDFLDNW